jgi:hypothetical protein
VREGLRLRPIQDRKNELKELIIDNAPSLEKLLNLNLAYALHVTVVSAPKLETVGYVSDFHRGDMNRLVFGSTIIQVAVHFCVVYIYYMPSAFVSSPNVVLYA